MEDGEIEVATEIEEMAHQMYLEKKEEMLQKKLGDKGVGTGLGIENSPKENKIPPTNEKKSPSLLPPVKEKEAKAKCLGLTCFLISNCILLVVHAVFLVELINTSTSSSSLLSSCVERMAL